jgi:NO-binding membrane sensor protein with MHYT domain
MAKFCSKLHRHFKEHAMNEVMPTSYDPSLVTLSFVVAFVGSYIALSASQKLRSSQDRAYVHHLAIAGIALGGIGVWAMHFIGMLAMRMPLGLSYSMGETVVSLVAAAAASAWALSIVARNPQSLRHLLGAGAMLGVGVCAMHYLGMYGMRFGGFFQWDMALVGVSVVIALVAATAALWLAFNTPSQWARVVAALVMAVAVCAMHYTGMLAAEIVCTTTQPLAMPAGFGLLSVLQLPMLVITLVVGMTLAIGINLLFAPHTALTRRDLGNGAAG